jgi:type IV pilus assembly protein PilE
MFRDNRQRGFTLIEMMIVVTVIGLLAALAFPTYMDQVRKARRSDGQDGLTRAVQRMELQYARNATYVGATLDNIAPTNITQSTDGYYTITITAQGVTNYTLRATPNTRAFALPAREIINQQLDYVIWFDINSQGQKTHLRRDGQPPHVGWKSP